MEIAGESEYYDVGPIALYTGILGSAWRGEAFWMRWSPCVLKFPPL